MLKRSLITLVVSAGLLLGTTPAAHAAPPDVYAPSAVAYWHTLDALFSLAPAGTVESIVTVINVATATRPVRFWGDVRQVVTGPEAAARTVGGFQTGYMMDGDGYTSDLGARVYLGGNEFTSLISGCQFAQDQTYCAGMVGNLSFTDHTGGDNLPGYSI